mgnify:FL=1
MKKIELLSPVGNMDCMRAAVQNGADAVYFGSGFSARAFASNFDGDDLKCAIEYAKLRGVQTHLTLNTLIKNDEFENAFSVAQMAYNYGIDAIIVQDLGLANLLINSFPNIAIHASTQLTAHNLDGVLSLQDMGFRRVVLSRELTLEEIEYITKNSNVEIETFIHGALCISYSGQCLFSSMVGGRSGNRGKCAQPCRLPFSLIDERSSKLDSGYLLSTRDLCGLDFIPNLINAGVTSLKIEGRMKSPEYVATVTRIYRKYIDLAYSNEPYIVEASDRKLLALAFNRGGFSNGHLSKDYNKNLVFKEKQNNCGLFLGTIEKYNAKKGLITFKCAEILHIGDSIATQNEQGSYKISELMLKNTNIKESKCGDVVTIGRMKGNIKPGDKLYKISDSIITSEIRSTFSENSENRKVKLIFNSKFALNKPIELSIKSNSNIDVYKDLNINITSSKCPEQAKNSGLSKENIIKQFSKTNNTPYEFCEFNIELEDNLFLPNSVLNELKREVLSKVKAFAISNTSRNLGNKNLLSRINSYTETSTSTLKIALLLNNLNLESYDNLQKIDKLYIPLKFFINQNYCDKIKYLSNKASLYIYLPTIMRNNYNKLFANNLENIITNFDIHGFVVSNISGLYIIKKLTEKYNKNFEFISNYTLNVYNSYSAYELQKRGITTVTLSPELDKEGLISLCNSTSNSELIVYGNLPLMNMNYCLFGTSNKCYSNCKHTCNSNNKYYLNDRMNVNFRIIPDNIDTVTIIYNSKITSIASDEFNVSSLRIDILDESIDEINKIINTVKLRKKLEGKNYTNGNLQREI